MRVESGAEDWLAFLPLDDGALLAQCRFDRFRGSGPGGQKRNVTDSAVRLRHSPTGLTSEANESRSQHENRARALRRLRLEIALHQRASIDLDAYEPPAELVAACGGGVGRRDARYLYAIAQAFDLLEAVGWRLSEAAGRINCSTAALGRLLMSDPVVLRAANGRRESLGHAHLRTAR